MYGFDKTRRLLTRGEYDHVFKHAIKLKNHDFTLLFCKNNLEKARLGLVLSKKTINKAHDRNYVKRLLRESFRLHGDLPPVDVIVLARPAINQSKPCRIKLNLDKLWNTLSIQPVS
jgi:ribonuclease P protein component